VSGNPGALPRLDQRGRDALQRLRATPDFKLYEQHMQDLLRYYQRVLVTAPSMEVPQMQGRCQMLLDLTQLK
jgi:hypothetical protein